MHPRRSPRPNRRDVLGASLAGGLAWPLARSGAEPVQDGADARGPAGRLLVLGGTRFLGPAVVDAALAAGWDVTLFNRGRSDPELYAHLDQRTGDRDTGDLSALEEGRWDAVVDTSGYVPGHVRAAAELLRDRVDTYVFVSTVSVYPDQSAEVVGEDTEVGTLTDEILSEVTTIQQSFRHYGPMKAYCEKAAEEAMPGRVANVRPGLIVGPTDRSDRFTYWPVRVARGGEVLAPGDPGREVQYIDVRDLGAWLFRLVAERTTGVYNAVGFRGRQSIEELLHGCKIVLGADARFTWVDDAFLSEHEVAAYSEMPLYLPGGQRGHFDVSRALAAGLELRPAGETIRDTYDWAVQRGDDHRWRAGMAADREAAILGAWNAR